MDSYRRSQKQFIFGKIVVFTGNRFLARQAYEVIVKQGLQEEGSGVVTLGLFTAIHWKNLSHHMRRLTLMF